MPKSYEDDIRDILDGMDDFLPENGQPRRDRRRRSYGQRSAAGDTWRNFTAQFQGGSLTPHKLMGGSILLMLFGWLLGIFSPGLAQFCTITRHRRVRHRPHLVHPRSRRRAYRLFLPAVLAGPGHRDAGPLVARRCAGLVAPPHRTPASSPTRPLRSPVARGQSPQPPPPLTRQELYGQP